MSAPYRSQFVWLGLAVVLATLGVLAYATRDRWIPDSAVAPKEPTEVDDHGHDHEGHDHAGHDHGEGREIELSSQALSNIGYEPYTIAFGDHTRQLTLPAMVVERPGRSQVHITAPMTGVVTNIFRVTGEAVDSGDPLFEMRLTHEDLVSAQREFLESLATLDVVNKELSRLRALGEGVVAGKRILDQEYEKQKLDVALRAAEQAMLLHGMTAEQVESVRSTGQLFQNIIIRTPEHGDADEACEGPHLFTLQRLAVARGELVEIGRELAVLADHCELHIEALAFEDDAAAIRSAAQDSREVSATLLDKSGSGEQLKGLEILYVASEIDPVSRAFKVYVRLPNSVALDKASGNGKRFLEWAFKPGQRLQLRVPVETWKNRLVVPVAAVVDEGAEAYVYRQHGDRFEQVPVHVEYRDRDSVVIADDGSLFKGDFIAGRGAYQIHLALKNQSGGAIDPHAGHNH
ncbi:efflux RND transporter periplasmic adaptor subunit [Aeoliella sp. SH292]|uniref:efflux RND transporter periplasmic adaptor subunit n=1 Tax=Aeoliella sp. SH292 TaxID=3454464 RepID=UPI003F9E3D30